MSLNEILTRAPVVPVIVIEDLEHAVPLARSLIAGGLPVLEITLRTPVAMEAIKMIIGEVPEAIVGVGTVTHPDQLLECKQVGAQFAVSPGLTPALIDCSRDIDIPFLPGVFTPSEAMQARDLGFKTLKLFPAAQAGGVSMLKAMNGPLPDIKFCPTGGIGPTSLLEYLKLPNVLCVGGSWVAPKQSMHNGSWQQITQLSTEAVMTAKNL
ncbi:MAG: bifunctional 4-hydroxy-2-oxoglutarate aldolase/2-dehydro-3-deoxy-phosphogluconate aldolase [Gammaproteobacteria bacterium]|nr:bifunctional 4-hydroxy-2-oxoglutarate aldolase/2-dehydro-3-deoxy-phosphogluconate aldolase [Gammaproteobacteria bacterium]